MVKLRHGAFFCFAWIVVGFASLLFVSGCNKSSSSSAGGNKSNETLVELGGTDVGADGKLSDSALETLQSKSSEPALAVTFVRTKLSDAGLAQLAKFPNLRRVTAFGSDVTQAGIDKLKQANPNVEVNK
jgi:hypothetical protein